MGYFLTEGQLKYKREKSINWVQRLAAKGLLQPTNDICDATNVL